MSIAIPVFQFFGFFMDAIDSIIQSFEEFEKNIKKFDWDKGENISPKDEEV
tara:strand:- start:497 stop:649 length:153 start_codon:yes stop_codon:yes gene_type:complete